MRRAGEDNTDNNNSSRRGAAIPLYREGMKMRKLQENISPGGLTTTARHDHYA
jgi:hypothetical protein